MYYYEIGLTFLVFCCWFYLFIRINLLPLNIRKLNLVDFQFEYLVLLDAILKVFIFPYSSFLDFSIFGVFICGVFS